GRQPPVAAPPAEHERDAARSRGRAVRAVRLPADGRAGRCGAAPLRAPARPHLRPPDGLRASADRASALLAGEGARPSARARANGGTLVGACSTSVTTS